MYHKTLRESKSSRLSTRWVPDYCTCLTALPAANTRFQWQLSKTYHPDLGTASSSERRFAEISEAYNTLSNESQRRNYDRSLATSSAFASGGYTTNAARHSTANYAWAHARRHNASSYAHFRRPAGGASSTSSSRRHDYTEQLFDRMQARADRMSNLWGTQMNRERMQSQQRAWDAANQEATSTTKRVAQIIGALVLVSMVSHVTRVSAETNAEKVTLIRRDIAKGANIQHIQSPLDRALHRMSAKDLEGHATSTLPDSMLDQDRQDTRKRGLT